MARPGDELVNPLTGQRLVFRQTTQETGGELLEVESFFQSGGVRPPAHYHPRQRERHEVLSGSLRVSIGGEERTLGPGEVLLVEPGTAHAMWNDGDEETHTRWETRPALKTERFFETIWGLAHAGKTDARGVPNLLPAAVLLHEYADEYRLVRPPRIVQQVVFALVAPIGRLLGYRAS